MSTALWLGKLIHNCIGKMKDALDTQKETLRTRKFLHRGELTTDATLQLKAYEQVTQHLLAHQKIQRIKKKLKNDVKSRIPGKQPFPVFLE